MTSREEGAAALLDGYANWLAVEHPEWGMHGNLREAAEALREPAFTQVREDEKDRKLEVADKIVDVIVSNVGRSAIEVYNTLIKLCEEYRNEPSK